MSHNDIQKLHAFNDAIFDRRRNKYAIFFFKKNAIYNTMGPAMIVEGKQKLDFGKMQI